MTDIIVILISLSNHCIIEMIEKYKEFPSSISSFSVKVDWREREMMNSSGLECEVCVVHFRWIKGERGWI